MSDPRRGKKTQFPLAELRRQPIYRRLAGYEGAMVSDHTPQLTGDRPGGKLGRSFAHGYIRALIHAVNAEGS